MSAGAYCYLVFFGVCMAVAAYVFFIVPETKNKTFVEISQMFAARNGMLEEESSELSVVNNLKLAKMNGYGTVDLEYEAIEKKK